MTSSKGGWWQLRGWLEKGGEHRGQGLARLIISYLLISCQILSYITPSDQTPFPLGGARLQSEQGNDAENEEEGGGGRGGEVADRSVEKCNKIGERRIQSLSYHLGRFKFELTHCE